MHLQNPRGQRQRGSPLALDDDQEVDGGGIGTAVVLVPEAQAQAQAQAQAKHKHEEQDADDGLEQAGLVLVEGCTVRGLEVLLCEGGGGGQEVREGADWCW